MKNKSITGFLDWSSRSVLSVASSLVLSACGNLTGGGFGEATVNVSGDHEPPMPSPSMSTSEAPAASSIFRQDGAEEAEGEVEIDFQVFLVNELGQQVQLGDDELRVKVDLQGVILDEAVREFVDAVRYTELRVIFTKIQAEVEGGLVVNGVPILGEVHVELEDVSLEVTRPIDVDLQPGGEVGLILDLNAPAWLAGVNPITQTVDETVFAALVGVVVS
jgi:hypothetical protein